MASSTINHVDLGQLYEGHVYARKSLAEHQRLLTRKPDDDGQRGEVVAARAGYASALRHLGKIDDARREFTQSLAEQRTLVAKYADHANAWGRLASIATHAGTLELEMKLAVDAERLFREAAAADEELASRFPTTPELRDESIGSRFSLAEILVQQNQLDKAESHLRVFIDVNHRHTLMFPARLQPRLAEIVGRRRLADIHEDRGQREEAIAEYRRAISVADTMLKSPNLAKSGHEIMAELLAAAPHSIRDLDLSAWHRSEATKSK